jgi:hypothetical protein
MTLKSVLQKNWYCRTAIGGHAGKFRRADLGALPMALNLLQIMAGFGGSRAMALQRAPGSSALAGFEIPAPSPGDPGGAAPAIGFTGPRWRRRHPLPI